MILIILKVRYVEIPPEFEYNDDIPRKSEKIV